MIHLIQKFLQYDGETPLYPDFSIESRRRRIVREISGMRNGDAAFLVFFHEKYLPNHIRERVVQAVILALSAKILINLR